MFGLGEINIIQRNYAMENNEDHQSQLFCFFSKGVTYTILRKLPSSWEILEPSLKFPFDPHNNLIWLALCAY